MTKISDDDPLRIPPVKKPQRPDNERQEKPPEEKEEKEETQVPGPAAGLPIQAIKRKFIPPGESPAIAAARVLPPTVPITDPAHLLPPGPEIPALPEAPPSEGHTVEKILEIEEGKPETAESAGGPRLSPLEKLVQKAYAPPPEPESPPSSPKKPGPDKPKGGGGQSR